MQQPTSEAFAAFVGLDWAAAKHEVCLQAAGTAQRALLRLDHSPAEMKAWGQTLRTRFNGQPLAVCLALPKGPLVAALRHDDCLVLFPLNPLPVATDREAFTPSRAKEAPTAAALQVESLRKHRDQLTPLRPQSPPRRALAQLVEYRWRLVGDNVRLPNRLPRALKNYFPQVRQWLPDKDPVIFGAFLSRWPTLKAAQRARRSTLEGCCRAHHVPSVDVIETRLPALKRARALTPDAGVLTPHVLLGQALVAPLRLTLQAIADFDTAIAQRPQDHPACPLFDAWPGAGAVLAPRLLVAFGEQRERGASAEALPKYAGMAPVTDRSDKKAWVPWRLQCPTLLRQTFVEWAAASTRHAFWAQVYSQQQRDNAQAPQAAVRALACTWSRSL